MVTILVVRSTRAIIVGMERERANDSEDTHDDLPLRVAAATSLRRLSHALVGHRAQPEVLEALADRAASLAERLELEPSRTRGDEMGFKKACSWGLYFYGHACRSGRSGGGRQRRGSGGAAFWKSGQPDDVE